MICIPESLPEVTPGFTLEGGLVSVTVAQKAYTTWTIEPFGTVDYYQQYVFGDPSQLCDDKKELIDQISHRVRQARVYLKWVTSQGLLTEEQRKRNEEDILSTAWTVVYDKLSSLYFTNYFDQYRFVTGTEAQSSDSFDLDENVPNQLELLLRQELRELALGNRDFFETVPRVAAFLKGLPPLGYSALIEGQERVYVRDFDVKDEDARPHLDLFEVARARGFDMVFLPDLAGHSLKDFGPLERLLLPLFNSRLESGRLGYLVPAHQAEAFAVFANDYLAYHHPWAPQRRGISSGQLMNSPVPDDLVKFVNFGFRTPSGKGYQIQAFVRLRDSGRGEFILRSNRDQTAEYRVVKRDILQRFSARLDSLNREEDLIAESMSCDDMLTQSRLASLIEELASVYEDVSVELVAYTHITGENRHLIPEGQRP